MGYLAAALLAAMGYNEEKYQKAVNLRDKLSKADLIDSYSQPVRLAHPLGNRNRSDEEMEHQQHIRRNESETTSEMGINKGCYSGVSGTGTVPSDSGVMKQPTAETWPDRNSPTPSPQSQSLPTTEPRLEALPTTASRLEAEETLAVKGIVQMHLVEQAKTKDADAARKRIELEVREVCRPEFDDLYDCVFESNIILRKFKGLVCRKEMGNVRRCVYPFKDKQFLDNLTDDIVKLRIKNENSLIYQNKYASRNILLEHERHKSARKHLESLRGEGKTDYVETEQSAVVAGTVARAAHWVPPVSQAIMRPAAERERSTGEGDVTKNGLRRRPFSISSRYKGAPSTLPTHQQAKE